MEHIRFYYKYWFLFLMFISFLVLSFPAFAEESDHSQHKREMKHPTHKMGVLDKMGKMNKEAGIQMDIAMGKMVYAMTCIYCHGKNGKGDGSAAIYIAPYSAPRPRDFSRGVFKFRSTKSGNLPTEFDLMRTVRDGIPGYMPSFRHLGREKLRQVVLYITQFYKKKTERKIKRKGKPYEKISIDHSVSFTMESIVRGEKIYKKFECFKCHGIEGKGDGPSADTLTDEKGLPIKPTNLTQPSIFKNGNNHEDIYRSIISGLSGSPMPSFADSFKGRETGAWDLVHYILSLSPEEEWTRMGRTK